MPSAVFAIFRRARSAWTSNFSLRLGVSLSLILCAVMATGAAFLTIHQNHALRQAAEERARAIARTFAAVGSAAVLDNLYRLQESLQLYMQDESLVEIDIVDNDNMVVAAKQPGRIGTTVDDAAWIEARKTKREVVEDTTGVRQSTLVIIEPLFDGNEIAAWVRMVVSLAHIEQEQAQILWRLLAVTLAIVLVGVYAIRLVLRKTSVVLQRVVSTLQTAGAPLGAGGAALAPSAVSAVPGGDFERLLTVATDTAHALGTQARALQDLTQSLESKVRARTNDLEAARAQAVHSLEELRDKEARLRSLVDNAADGILVTDARGVIESVNPAACALFGEGVADLHGREIQSLFHRIVQGGDQQKAGYEQPLLVVGTKEDAVGRRKDGTLFESELSVSQMILAGTPHYTIIVRDVTQRRLMEDLKQRNAQQLHRLGEERAQLYHDLHASLLQSLSVVSLGMETSKLLLVQAPDRAPKQVDLALAQLYRVIQDARDFIARLEPRTEPANSFLHALQQLVQRTDVWPCPPFLIDIDPSTAGQLSLEHELHLLAIAREVVGNTVRHARAASGSIRFGRKDGVARLEIRDDGIGFRTGEGTHYGLGFTNVATHVKQLRGQVTVESVPGKGTTVVVTVPVSREVQRLETAGES